MRTLQVEGLGSKKCRNWVVVNVVLRCIRCMLWELHVLQPISIMKNLRHSLATF